MTPGNSASGVCGLKSLLNIFQNIQKIGQVGGAISNVAYYKRAVKLADSNIGGKVVGFVSKQGWTFKYNKATGEFLTIHPKGYIETFFRPKGGMNYYLKQLQLYGQ